MLSSVYFDNEKQNRSYMAANHMIDPKKRDGVLASRFT